MNLEIKPLCHAQKTILIINGTVAQVEEFGSISYGFFIADKNKEKCVKQKYCLSDKNYFFICRELRKSFS